MVRRMYDRGNVVGRNALSGKSPSGKCLAGQVSIEELSFGKTSAWDLSMKKCQSKNCTDTN